MSRSSLPGTQYCESVGGSSSSGDLEAAIAELLQPSIKDGMPMKRKRLEDSVFPQITGLLRRSGKRTWSLRPRTYAILCMIDRLDVMEKFVNEGLHDISLPYSHKTFPVAPECLSTREQFLKFQHVVISGQLATIENGEGQHVHSMEDGDEYFKHIKPLGEGGFGEVDHVCSRLSFNNYARKRMPRGRGFKEDKEAVLNFKRELDILKSLSHHHLVKCVGSYSGPHYIGLIMSPVAESNLAELLGANPFPAERLLKLRHFYGCLSTALLFLHEKKIRHKDIKPSNILVYGGNILITDFGASLDWKDRGQSTTTSKPGARTLRYCAPEVYAWEPRNTLSDIYSLGCVFMEMTTVLRGETLGRMKEFFTSHGTNEDTIRTNQEAMELWCVKLHGRLNPAHDNEPLKWIKDMVKVKPEDRPSASQLINRIRHSEGEFCGTCCREDKTGSTVSSCQESVGNGEIDVKQTVIRICHTVWSMETLFGNAWLRESNLKVRDHSKAAARKHKKTRSFIFYPSRLLTSIGLGYGMEANMANSLQFDFSVVRVVPENSRIFESSRDGNFEEVRRLLQEGKASVRDTSSTGWTSLHFAAQAANLELCKHLISAGADKTAKAYERPSGDALSPVAIFARSAQSMHADQKIQMLNLFTDSLELSEPASDGWTVLEALVQSYNKENVSLLWNSVNWFLRTLPTDGMVACDAKTVWHGLQNAVRSFLVRERRSKVLDKLLSLNTSNNKTVGTSRGTSIAHWLALGASRQELLPMIVEAGIRLHINGFDWVDDGTQEGPAFIARQLPVIYAAWAKALPGGIKRVDKLIEDELLMTLANVGWTQEALGKFISSTTTKAEPSPGDVDSKCCSACNDDYGSLRISLVAPAWITFTECVKSEHRFDCACTDFCRRAGVAARAHPLSSVVLIDHSLKDSIIGEDNDIKYQITAYAEQEFGSPEDNSFLASATLLYRAQGRTWVGFYNPDDRLCATCFLTREEYISKEGLGNEQTISPVPPTYAMIGPEG